MRGACSFSEYIDDGECDKACNVAECRYDGSDCAHGHSECFAQLSGEDYRGAINVTASGRPCQRWSSQFPQQHFFTHARYPLAGLGAHSACRNPGGVNEGPWCYTNEPKIRWEVCAVGTPSASGCSGGNGRGGNGGFLGSMANRSGHLPAAKARGPSACERICPLSFALITGSGGSSPECEGVDDCSCDGEPCAPSSPSSSPTSSPASSASSSAWPNASARSAAASRDPCRPERRACAVKRSKDERLSFILWVSLFGTSLFVLLLVYHVYNLTSPHGSPRSGGGGYNAIAMNGGGMWGLATPNTAAAPGMPLPVFSFEGPEARRIRDKELEAAESAVIDSLVD